MADRAGAGACIANSSSALRASGEIVVGTSTSIGDQQVAQRRRHGGAHPRPRTRRMRPLGVPGGHPYRHRAVQCGHTKVRAEHRLDVADRHGQREVVALAPEDGVGPHPDQQMQVAGRPAALARLAPPGQPDALTVVDPGRDADVERTGLGDPAGAPALGTLLVDHGADALALPARLGERERPLVGGDQPGAVADRARARLGAGLGPAAVAGVADTGRPQRDRQRGPVHGVGEVERDLGLDVATPLGTATTGAAGPAAEDGPEQVGESRPAEALVPGGRRPAARGSR